MAGFVVDDVVVMLEGKHYIVRIKMRGSPDMNYWFGPEVSYRDLWDIKDRILGVCDNKYFQPVRVTLVHNYLDGPDQEGDIIDSLPFWRYRKPGVHLRHPEPPDDPVL